MGRKLDKFLSEYDRRQSSYLRPKPGQSVMFRFLQGYDPIDERKAKKAGAELDVESGVLLCHQHAFLPRLNKTKDGKRYDTNYRCLTDIGKSCGFCNYFDNLPDSDRDFRYQHGRKVCAFVDVYLVKEGTWKRWFLGKRMMERVVELFGDDAQLNNPDKARNMILSREGSGLATQWTLKKGEKCGKVDLPDDAMPYILDELENMPILTQEQINKVLKLKFK